jgi:fructokinase
MFCCDTLRMTNAPLLAAMGEMLIDFIPIQHEGRTTGFSMAPGGSPFNVAVGLARLGARTAFVSKASTDYFGRFLTRHLDAQGVDTRFLVDDPAFSTLAFVAYEDGEPNYSFYGDGMADTRLRADDIPQAFYDEAELLHFGSISLLRGESPEAILTSAERLKGSALISFDPNIRPGLVRDRAAYIELLDRAFTLADIIKISAADLAWLMPGAQLGEAAKALQLFGAELVVVTRGGDGALALHGKTALVAPHFDVDVVDTVGAGDAFSAGLLAELARRDVLSSQALATLPKRDLGDALRFASATAALTCTKAGAQPPSRAEVEALLARTAHV